MHYLAFVLIDKFGDIDEQVAALMDPHRETYDEETEKSSGWWDWYQIGGRWTGLLDGYEPEKDRHNMKPCWLCRATGKRADSVAIANPHLQSRCNGCDGTGIEIKWPTDWRRHDGDIQPAQWITEQVPYTLVSIHGVLQREVWNGVYLVKTERFEESVRNILHEHDGRLVVVDYHS